jgi:hypothetical protein
VAAGFQADKHRSFAAELAQTSFKGSKTFGVDDDFYRLEQHVAPSVNCRRAVEAFSNVDTNEDVDDCWWRWGFISFLFFWVMEGPLPILVAKSRMFPPPVRVRPGWPRLLSSDQGLF